LREHTDLSEKEIREIVKEKLSQVGLAGDMEKMPAELSGGMRRRAALARALALDPDIVLFDEPTTGLDPVVAATIEDLIIETQRRLGKTFVVITHDLKTALRIGQKLALLDRGQIALQGKPEDVLRSGHPLLEAFLRRERSPVVKEVMG
ncbi:MAG: ABC transporter ATP-binding protein, partial [Deltaproteobacteria bacterium]